MEKRPTMKKLSFGELKDIQKKTAKQVNTEDTFDEIKYIAGFDVAFNGDTAICGCAVLDAKTLEVKEKKHLVVKAPMQYVPGFLAFREGPVIMQLYFDLEYDPDVIIVDGHGILHEGNAGLASFVGVELAKPTIGVAKTLLVGEEKGDDILLNGEVCGAKVVTKEHANPVYVSPGNMISLKTAVELVKKMIVPPHKLPEPLHAAHRIARKVSKEMQSNDKIRQ
ncbi:endonuclease V [Candidatus Woesearchaeota archaeon]|nr:endonuclease V [Candidatus Woesearchaeota archaeon]